MTDELLAKAPPPPCWSWVSPLVVAFATVFLVFLAIGMMLLISEARKPTTAQVAECMEARGWEVVLTDRYWVLPNEPDPPPAFFSDLRECERG